MLLFDEEPEVKESSQDTINKRLRQMRQMVTLIDEEFDLQKSKNDPRVWTASTNFDEQNEDNYLQMKTTELTQPVLTPNRKSSNSSADDYSQWETVPGEFNPTETKEPTHGSWKGWSDPHFNLYVRYVSRATIAEMYGAAFQRINLKRKSHVLYQG